MVRLRTVTRWLGVGSLALVSIVWGRNSHAQPQLGNQLPNPRLLTVSPCGAKAGTSVEITWTGTDLEEPQAFLFSHPGIKAAPVIPPPPKEEPKKTDPKKTEPKKDAKPDAKKPEEKKPAPPPPPITKFTITVPADVPPGYYDVRLVNKFGVSNPRVFVVGDLNEVAEKEPNNTDDQAQRVEIGTTINGAINAATDVDYAVFAGKKGQRVLISCLGPSIDSRLAPELKVFDATQRELASHRPLPQQDAFVDLNLPADGDYYVRLCQFTYTAGSPEYFYRLNISTGSWVEAVHPPMIEPGKTTPVTVYGRNLPGGKPETRYGAHPGSLQSITTTVTAPADPAAL